MLPLFTAGPILATVYLPKYRPDTLFPIVIAPFGAILRYLLSQLNKKIPEFPLGTFCANIGGSFLLSVLMLLQQRDFGKVPCAALSGLAVGFCSGLTTVSTFSVELTHLSTKQSFVYALSSITIGLIIYTLVDGLSVCGKGFGANRRFGLEGALAVFIKI